MNAKDFALNKVKEILQICDDLKYIQNRTIQLDAIMRIKELTSRIEEHLEYLDIKE